MPVTSSACLNVSLVGVSYLCVTLYWMFQSLLLKLIIIIGVFMLKKETTINKKYIEKHK